MINHVSEEWAEKTNFDFHDNHRTATHDFEYIPQETINRDFDIVGSLSDIVSRNYINTTISEGADKITPSQEPEHFKIFIPHDYNYKKSTLRLWQISMYPQDFEIELIKEVWHPG